MKRLLTLITAIIMVLQASVFTAFAASNDDISNMIDVLESLSIYHENDEMDLTDEYITRESLAQILSVFYGHERNGQITEYSGKSYYSDVEATRPSAYEIMLMTGAGFMSGYIDGTFRPENKVRFIDALKPVIDLLGYHDIAAEHGGWPEGYKIQAVHLHLSKNMDITYDDYMMKGDFTQLIWNALDVKVLLTAPNSRVEYGEKLLNEMSFYELKGVLTATDQTGLFGYDSCSRNHIRIDDTLIYTEKDCNEFLGQSVIVYYELTDDNDVVLRYIGTDGSRNKIVKVEAKNISSETTTSSFEYFDNSKIRRIPIESDTSVIFNGKRLTYFELEHLIPQTGTVTLIDPNGGNDYETIIIESYVDYFVSSVYNDGTVLTIAERNGRLPVTLELRYANKNITVKRGEEVLDTSALVQDMLISVAGDKMESDESGNFMVSDKSTVFKILFSGKAVMGEITRIGDEGFKVTVNGNEYEVSRAINLSNNYFVFGKTGLFYLNAFDEVAKVRYVNPDETVTYVNENLETVTATNSDGESYGFIRNAYGDTNLSGDTVYIRMFTESGEFMNFKALETTSLDGKRHNKNTLATTFLTNLKNSASEFKSKTVLSDVNASGYEQLVRYSLKADGTLASIDTIAPNYDNSVMEKDCFSFGIRIALGDPSDIPGLGDNYIHRLESPRSVEGIVSLPANFKMFVVPADFEAESGYALTSVPETTTTPMSFFDMDDFQVSKVGIMQTAYSEDINLNFGRMMIVQGKIQVMNSRDEVVDALKGVQISTGNEIVLEISDNVENIDDIRKGDIIRWNEDSYGMARLVELSWSLDGRGTCSIFKWAPTYSQFYAGGRIAAGKVQNISKDYILIKYETQSIPESNPLKSLSTVLVVDKTTMNVSKGDISMIKSAVDFGEAEASTVFTYQNYAQPLTIVIFN